MAKQLDILALEPFFGGARRAMLETVVRCSRHRWTVLKLPPRRIERRLAAAANWFAEQVSRHWVGRLDLLFTSEAMNLASLYRLAPQLARHPSVVYFHDNQLPPPTTATATTDGPRRDDREIDLVNLNTAQSAGEIWFNSAYHQRAFLAGAGALVSRHPELSGRNPMPAIASKARLMPPPVDLGIVHEVEDSAVFPRDPRSAFVETRDADVGLLNAALAVLRERGVPVSLTTVGPVDALDPAVPRRTVPETDVVGQVRAMLESGVVLSVKPNAASDHLVIRALTAGCRPVLPDAGVYPEILPHDLHATGLYDVIPEGLADRLQTAMIPLQPPWRYNGNLRDAFKCFDAITACRAFDERVEQLVGSRAPT